MDLLYWYRLDVHCTGTYKGMRLSLYAIHIVCHTHTLYIIQSET